MENSELVVPTNSRLDDSPANGVLDLETSPVPPKCSPVSSVSRISLASKSKHNDEKLVYCEDTKQENSSCSFIEEEKEVADILKSRLYDNAGTSEVYKNLSTTQVT